MNRSVKNGTATLSAMVLALSCFAAQPSYGASAQPAQPVAAKQSRLASIRNFFVGKSAKILFGVAGKQFSALLNKNPAYRQTYDAKKKAHSAGGDAKFAAALTAALPIAAPFSLAAGVAATGDPLSGIAAGIMAATGVVFGLMTTPIIVNGLFDALAVARAETVAQMAIDKNGGKSVEGLTAAEAGSIVAFANDHFDAKETRQKGAIKSASELARREIKAGKARLTQIRSAQNALSDVQ